MGCMVVWFSTNWDWIVCKNACHLFWFEDGLPLDTLLIGSKNRCLYIVILNLYIGSSPFVECAFEDAKLGFYGYRDDRS